MSASATQGGHNEHMLYNALAVVSANNLTTNYIKSIFNILADSVFHTTSNSTCNIHQVTHTPLHFAEHTSLPVAVSVSPAASDWNPIQL